MARTTLRPELCSIIPPRMQNRPIDARGYSIPWFVDYIDGQPDFRCADQRKLRRAIAHKLCWLCGEKLGRHLSFVIGPMCVVNRVTSEPPCHLDCATYAVKGCPFMTLPAAQYRTANLPACAKAPGGVLLQHNPTACAIYTTHDFSIFLPGNGILFRLAEAESVTFWHRGRLATRAELDAALAIGFPKVHAMAVEEGPAAVAKLDEMLQAAQRWFPPDAPTAAISCRPSEEAWP
jgi:hypothetical protein